MHRSNVPCMKRELSPVDARIAAAVAEAPLLPDDVAELWGRLIRAEAIRPAPAPLELHAPAS
jgi:hypothetical protein